MGKIVEIQVGEYRPVAYFDANETECHRDDQVIVEMDRGSEFGRVVSDAAAVCRPKPEAIEGKVLRKATEGDLKQIENNRIKAKDAMSNCLRKINERTLDMQMVKAEYSFD